MGDGDEDSKKITKTVEMEKKMRDISSNSTSSRDLLQRFRGTTSSSDSGAKREEENEEIELNLGLSLGGRFGVDRSRSRSTINNKLVRSSSSIGAACLPHVVVRDDDDGDDVGPGRVPQAPVAHTGLVRTSSLPVESEEEWRKRKEMQGLRRMEAKRRRSEKQRNLRSEREGGGGSSMSLGDKKEIEVNLRGELQREKSLQGSGELSPASIQSLQDASNQEIGSSRQREHTRSDIVARNRGREINVNALEEMPCVFTKGDGSNGGRVDGILYKYGKGEEVRIMCVCHGTFHSPAEFVSHGGGTDVDNPLKHIVVNPNAAPLV